MIEFATSRRARPLLHQRPRKRRIHDDDTTADTAHRTECCDTVTTYVVDPARIAAPLPEDDDDDDDNPVIWPQNKRPICCAPQLPAVACYNPGHFLFAFWDVLVDPFQRMRVGFKGMRTRSCDVLLVFVVLMAAVSDASAAAEYYSSSNALQRNGYAMGSAPAVGRVCESVEVRNTVSNFFVNGKLENCTVIEGNLNIVLIKAYNASVPNSTSINNISFPMLREVTGYVVFWRVNDLRSIGTLFPNLAVIRGHTLFLEYALIIYELADLQEIGLHSLTNILQGGVRIEDNSNLCYYDTIDWNALAPRSNGFIKINNGKSRKDRKICPTKCPDRCMRNGQSRCWNKDKCQLDLGRCPGGTRIGNSTECCHESCLGGCTGNTSKDCTACKNVRWKGDCLQQCLSNTVKYLDWRCVQHDECFHFPRPEDYPYVSKPYPYRPVEGNCSLSCPTTYYEDFQQVQWGEMNHTRYVCKPCKGTCRKECSGGKIDSIAGAQRFAGCTHITESLEIVGMHGSNVAKELENSLGTIEEIRGYLKVARMKQLISLNFLRNLKLIRGDILDNHNVFILQNNDNLEELWDWSSNRTPLKIRTGKFFFHYNPKLCYEKIEKLGEMTGINFTEHNAPKESNGDEVACNVTEITTTVVVKKHNAVVLKWSSFTNHDERTILGYEIHYVEAGDRNVTLYDGRDACKDDGWIIVDVLKEEGSFMSSVLTNLKPYTRYAYYVKAYMVKKENNGAQSAIGYFVTAPSTPSMPYYVRAVSNSTSEIVVTWKPPIQPNGNLTHYIITWAYENDSVSDDINYCDINYSDRLPITNDDNTVTEKISKNIPDLVEPEDNCQNTKGCKCCECGNKEEKERPNLNEEDEIMRDEIRFEDSMQNYYYVKRVKQVKRDLSALRDLKNRSAVIQEQMMKVPVPRTSAVITGLHYSTKYSIFVKACRAEVASDRIDINSSTHQRSISSSDESKEKVPPPPCSGTKLVSGIRTHKNESADDIRDVRVDKNIKNGTVTISWQEPLKPNGIVLFYQLERIYEDVNISSTDCKLPRELERRPNYRLALVWRSALEAGVHSVRVRVVTLASSGPWSRSVQFRVAAPPPSAGGAAHHPGSTMDLLIGVVIAVVIVVVFVGGYVCWRKFNPKVPKLFPIVNPDYIPTDYVPDEWEVPRESIELVRELGQGSFGMVYEGIAHNIVSDQPHVPCAVKTVNESANSRDRSEFLNEASVMKGFNTPHVVRLLGVVSKGQPVLVVMELMAYGDLKSYLRSHRPDWNDVPHPQPPTLKRIYQMAIEIADGMAYLTAKKFVHRDLAARNCMVAEDLTVKIGDFGMTRDIYETDYYKKGTKGLLPVRWMAPESLKDGVFTNRSDVWSYGVVLWEMVTLASQPYQGLSNDQVLRYVIDGGVMARPDNCPDKLYELMKRCWQHKPQMRATFMDLVESLLPDVNSSFIDNSFYHSPEAADLRMHEAEVQAVELEASYGTPLTPLRATTELDDDDDEFASICGSDAGAIPLVASASASPYIRPIRLTSPPSVDAPVKQLLLPNSCNGANGYVIPTSLPIISSAPEGICPTPSSTPTSATPTNKGASQPTPC